MSRRGERRSDLVRVIRSLQVRLVDSETELGACRARLDLLRSYTRRNFEFFMSDRRLFVARAVVVDGLDPDEAGRLFDEIQSAWLAAENKNLAG